MPSNLLKRWFDRSWKWRNIRVLLRVVAAMAGAGATALAAEAGPMPPLGVVLSMIAAGAGLAPLDMPRDEWTPEQRKAHHIRRASREIRVKDAGG